MKKEPEYDDIPEEQQLTLSILSRSINSIFAIIYFIFLIVLFKVQKTLSFQSAMSIQILLSGYLRIASTMFPIINTPEKELS